MGLDAQIFYLLNNLAGQSPSFDKVVVFFASNFPYILIIFFITFLFLSQYSRLEKLQIFFVTVVSALVARFGVTEIIRFFYHSPRPFIDMPVNQLLTNDAWSFPSGHAAFFFALATAVYLYNKKWGVFFIIAATLISASRVIAGIHYPSDIIGGAIIGIAIAHITFHFYRKVAVYCANADNE